MLQNLLFSVNMSLPLFLLLGLGCVLTRKGMFSDDYVARTTNLVYYVMLPAKLFWTFPPQISPPRLSQSMWV